MKAQNRFDLLRAEDGASLVEMAVLLPLFLLLIFGAVDFGRAFYLEMELTGAAHAAVIYGSQYPTDTTGMQNAAKDDAPNVPSLNVGTPVVGCECADGTSYSSPCPTTPPACTTTNVVNRVNITVTATYSTLFPWPGVPSSMSLSSSASMRTGGS